MALFVPEKEAIWKTTFPVGFAIKWKLPNSEYFLRLNSFGFKKFSDVRLEIIKKYAIRPEKPIQLPENVRCCLLDPGASMLQDPSLIGSSLKLLISIVQELHETESSRSRVVAVLIGDPQPQQARYRCDVCNCTRKLLTVLRISRGWNTHAATVEYRILIGDPQPQQVRYRCDLCNCTTKLLKMLRISRGWNTQAATVEYRILIGEPQPQLARGWNTQAATVEYRILIGDPQPRQARYRCDVCNCTTKLLEVLWISRGLNTQIESLIAVYSYLYPPRGSNGFDSRGGPRILFSRINNVNEYLYCSASQLADHNNIDDTGMTDSAQLQAVLRPPRLLQCSHWCRIPHNCKHVHTGVGFRTIASSAETFRGSFSVHTGVGFRTIASSAETCRGSFSVHTGVGFRTIASSAETCRGSFSVHTGVGFRTIASSAETCRGSFSVHTGVGFRTIASSAETCRGSFSVHTGVGFRTIASSAETCRGSFSVHNNCQLKKEFV
ncbi:hypothetical protein J6590_052684 [Homalodisca vitripennis]|nr:hypothetical protein J6590_052684 [Homalodisca vitripennis]